MGEQIVDQAVNVIGEYLSRTAAGMTLNAADTAARTIHGLVSDRLGQTDDDGALAELGRNPRGDTERADLRYVIKKLVNRDAGFAAELSAALRKMPVHQMISTNQNLRFGHNARTGHIAGGNVTTSTVNEHGDRVTNRKSRVGLVVAVAILLLIVVVAATLAHGSGEITADSRCKDFLATAPADRASSVSKIALRLGLPEAGNPFTVPQIETVCGNHPDDKFGDVLKNQLDPARPPLPDGP